MFRNFLGTRYGHFFGFVPDYVDVTLKPGRTPISKPTLTAWLSGFIQQKHINSPNGVWLIMTIVFHYLLAPLDLHPTASAAAQGPVSLAYIKERLPLWLAFILTYVAFWHVTLYVLSWGRRPFASGGSLRAFNKKPYNWLKTIHNVYHNVCGILVWVVVENMFAYAWATQRLPYLSDAHLFGGSTVVIGSSSTATSTTAGVSTGTSTITTSSSTLWLLRLWNLFMVSAIPLWRDAHFFFAHHFLHSWRPIYLYVHSLHHRNTAVEPFAGLSMHTAEHVWYYCSVLVSIIFSASLSPFLLIWNGAHLLLAPAASHSGWEDHFQSDAYHAGHHNTFEYNLAGASAAFLDASNHTFKGTWVEPKKKQPAADDATNNNNFNVEEDDEDDGDDAAAATKMITTTSKTQKRTSSNTGKKQTTKKAATNRTNRRSRSVDELEAAESSESDNDATSTIDLVAAHDAKANLFLPMPIDHLLYWILSIACFVVPLFYLNGEPQTTNFLDTKLFRGNTAAAKQSLPWLAALGPIGAAYALCYAFHPQRMTSVGQQKKDAALSGGQRLFNLTMHLICGPVTVWLMVRMCM